MIVTKEHQESMVEKYVKEKRNQDECIGFIDGMNKMLEFIASQPSPVMSAEQVEELIIEAANNHQLGGYGWQREKRESFQLGAKWALSNISTTPSVKADGCKHPRELRHYIGEGSAEQVDYGYYYPLFKFFSDEHGLTLLDSQLQDVIHECKKFIKPSPSVKAEGWVSVEDGLPIIPPKYWNAEYEAWLTPLSIRVNVFDGEDVYEYHFTGTFEDSITHWQPLPNPPINGK